MDKRPDCRCGHPWSAHQHYRAGEDCPFCKCAMYARVIWLIRPRKAYDPRIPPGSQPKVAA